ncbi:MAG: hypothetical protein KJ579_11285 [Verrucomicrobia bacterium]|nr:hypothetical protein [Verrucomicrobiota bacterium]
MKTPTPETPREGRVYLFLDGKPYRAGLVNACRVRLDPLFRKRREIVSRLHDTRRTIYAQPPSISISPGAKLVPVTVRGVGA